VLRSLAVRSGIRDIESRREKQMQNRHAPESTPIRVAVVLRRETAAVLGLGSVVVLSYLAYGLWSFADTYGNITEGGLPALAAVVAVLAAALGALAVALWKRPAPGKFVAKVFVGILAVATIIFVAVNILGVIYWDPL
jgi:hypothetical protein